MLKLYPAGMTKATILRGTPNASISSIARGRAASEVLVANAIVAGSETARRNRAIGMRANTAIGSSTSSRNAMSAAYPVNKSFPSGNNTPIPMWPTV